MGFYERNTIIAGAAVEGGAAVSTIAAV